MTGKSLLAHNLNEKVKVFDDVISSEISEIAKQIKESLDYNIFVVISSEDIKSKLTDCVGKNIDVSVVNFSRI